MANTNDNFFEDFFSDIPAEGGDFDFDNLFEDGTEKKEDTAPAAEPAPKKEPEKSESAKEDNEVKKTIIDEVDQQIEDAINDAENEAQQENEEPQEPAAENNTAEAKEQADDAEESPQEEASEQTNTEEAAPAETEAEAEMQAEAAAVAQEEAAINAETAEKAEDAAAEPVEEEPVVEVEKPKKTRKPRAKKAKAAPAVDGEIITEHSNEVNNDFISSLLVSPGKGFLDDKSEIEKLMSEITLEPGMSDAVVDTMLAKNLLLLQKIEGIAYAYHVAYENLTNKETGLIKRVQENAMLTSEGTEKDKKLAASVAVANYEYVKGHKVDLYQHANALRGAAYFIKQAFEFQKATSIALSTFRKHAA